MYMLDARMLLGGGVGVGGVAFSHISTRLLALCHVSRIMVCIKTDKLSCVGQLTNKQ